jgi:hypothetical protein
MHEILHLFQVLLLWPDHAARPERREFISKCMARQYASATLQWRMGSDNCHASHRDSSFATKQINIADLAEKEETWRCGAMQWPDEQ